MTFPFFSSSLYNTSCISWQRTCFTHGGNHITGSFNECGIICLQNAVRFGRRTGYRIEGQVVASSLPRLHPHKRPTPSMWPEWQLVGVLLSLWAAPYPQRAAKALTWCALVQLVCVIEFRSRRNDIEQSTTHAVPLPDTVSAAHSGSFIPVETTKKGQAFTLPSDSDSTNSFSQTTYLFEKGCCNQLFDQENVYGQRQENFNKMLNWASW